MSTSAITVLAPAKINLYLAVGGRRQDGYHDVTTVLQALELADEVTITPADSLSLECTPDLGIPAEENLVYRAAVAFGEWSGWRPDVRITLRKHVPSGAGLGGGSSDAAAVIAGLAKLREVAPDEPALARIARSLGADVPFFLVGGTALFDGRGDEFVRSLPTLPADIVLVKPDEPASTAAVYAAFDRMLQAPAPGARYVSDACRSGDLAGLALSLYNNLTEPSAGLVGSVADTLAWCRRSEGVLGAALCGSGSAVFAICRDAESATRTRDAALERGWWSAATRTSGSGALATGMKEQA